MIAAALRRLARLPLLAALLAGGLFTVLALFPFGGEAFRRRAIRRWSRMLVAACGVRTVPVTADGARPLAELPAGSLVVANHVSWLDIFVIHSQSPCAFVAKAEIRDWPLLGTLVSRTGTLFLERGKRHAVHRMIEHVGRRLEAGGRVAVFPEGTTSDGRRLLPFHANLIEAAVRARAPVVPVGLRYVDCASDLAAWRAASEDPPARGPDGLSGVVEYVGDITFVASLWRIIGSPGVRCEVHALAAIDPQPLARHAVAQLARDAIASRLALPREDALPEKLRELRSAGA